jgi:hypothetical protein
MLLHQLVNNLTYKQRRNGFIDVLSAMPDRILLLALDAKWADHKCISLRLALANAEIKSSERRVALLSTMYDQYDGAYAVSEVYLDILDQVVGIHDLTDAEGGEQHDKNTHRDQLAALAVSHAHMAQMQNVIGLRVSRWLGEKEGGSGKDLFHKYGEDPFNRYSEGEPSNEGTEDGSLCSPTHAGSPASSRQ